MLTHEPGYPILSHTPDAAEAWVPEPQQITQSDSTGRDVSPSGFSEPTCFLEMVPDRLRVPEFFGWYWEERGIVAGADHPPVCVHPVSWWSSRVRALHSAIRTPQTCWAVLFFFFS